MKRPYRAPGIGWILAAIVLVVALLTILHVVPIPVLGDPIVLIFLLALAILL